MSQLSRKLRLAAHRLRNGDRFRVHGVTVTVPPQVDPEVRDLLVRGRPYEDPEARFVAAYLTPGMNVVELGGSIGVVSALVRARIGSSATHLIVEANPMLAKVCAINAAVGADPGRSTVICAAIDYSGAPEVAFASGHNAHTGHLATSGEAGFTVPTTTLAAVASNLPAGNFALICDIEGAEAGMLSAERETLKRVALIVLETHPAAYGAGDTTKDSIIADLTAQGFALLGSADDVICLGRPGR